MYHVQIHQTSLTIARYPGNLICSLYNVWKTVGANRTRDLKAKDSRLESYRQALFRITPLLIFTTASVAWIMSPASNLLSNQKLIEWSIMLCESHLFEQFEKPDY